MNRRPGFTAGGLRLERHPVQFAQSVEIGRERETAFFDTKRGEERGRTAGARFHCWDTRVRWS